MSENVFRLDHLPAKFLLSIPLKPPLATASKAIQSREGRLGHSGGASAYVAKPDFGAPIFEAVLCGAPPEFAARSREGAGLLWGGKFPGAWRGSDERKGKKDAQR